MMATTEERLKILQMIQDGKVTAEDGAKLLAALSSGVAAGRTPARVPDARYFRVRVTDSFSGKTKVSVNLPMSLVEAGLSIASNFIPENVSEFDPAKITEAIRAGMTGKIVDVLDEEDGEHVEIFIE